MVSPRRRLRLFAIVATLGLVLALLPGSVVAEKPGDVPSRQTFGHSWEDEACGIPVIVTVQGFAIVFPNWDYSRAAGNQTITYTSVITGRAVTSTVRGRQQVERVWSDDPGIVTDYVTFSGLGFRMTDDNGVTLVQGAGRVVEMYMWDIHDPHDPFDDELLEYQLVAAAGLAPGEEALCAAIVSGLT